MNQSLAQAFPCFKIDTPFQSYVAVVWKFLNKRENLMVRMKISFSFSKKTRKSKILADVQNYVKKVKHDHCGYFLFLTKRRE